MYRYSKSTIILPVFPIFGLSVPPKIGYNLTWSDSDSRDFYSSEIRVTDLPMFVFTMPDFWEMGSKKSADSKKSGSGTRKAAITQILVIFTSWYSAGKMHFNIAKTRDFFPKLKELKL